MKAIKTASKSRLLIIVIIALIVAGSVFVVAKLLKPEEVDPHEGQVYVNDGNNDVWITPLEGVEVNTLEKEDFTQQSGSVHYTGEDFDTIRGIDVSEHQHDIDWQQVAESGVEFAFVRVGYRGYTEGGLFSDATYEYNIKYAAQNGIKVGVYFFSQAVTVAEAIEEANYVLELIKGYDVTLPIMFDWEKIEEDETARTHNVDSTIISDCGVAFCETVKNAGYDAGIYFNRQLGYYGYDLSRLKDFTFWVTIPGDFPDFYYAGNIWQYSFTETVPGIEYETDMNLMFIPKPVPEGEAEN